MPVDIYVCAECGDITFTQCVEIHVEVTDQGVRLVETAQLPMFKCANCGIVVRLADEDI